MRDAIAQMAAILRTCANTMRDIATTREGDERASVLTASAEAEQAAKTLERLDPLPPSETTTDGTDEARSDRLRRPN